MGKRWISYVTGCIFKVHYLFFFFFFNLLSCHDSVFYFIFYMCFILSLKVDSLPYQWLMVKNKTIIGPKSTEEQKVLFIPPHAGVYQCVLSVSSWPASAETEVAARANIFAKRVVLVAIAENPALEVRFPSVLLKENSWKWKSRGRKRLKVLAELIFLDTLLFFSSLVTRYEMHFTGFN